MTYIVGLTGGIGSGKTTIANLFSELGVSIVDADVVAREVVAKGSPLLNQIATYFGQDILSDDGSLNRTLLRQRAFDDPIHTQWLNGLLHPAIREKMFSLLKTQSSDYVLWVVPLLIENQLKQYCNRVLVIDVNEAVQLQRAVNRDRGKEQIQKIMAAQVSREQRLSYADDIIDNNQPWSIAEKNIRAQVIQLHQFYLEESKKAGRNE